MDIYCKILVVNLDGVMFIIWVVMWYMVEWVEKGDFGGFFVGVVSMVVFMGVVCNLYYVVIKGGVVVYMKGVVVEMV